jgi:hypothetical protein
MRTRDYVYAVISVRAINLEYLCWRYSVVDGKTGKGRETLMGEGVLYRPGLGAERA